MIVRMLVPHSRLCRQRHALSPLAPVLFWAACTLVAVLPCMDQSSVHAAALMRPPNAQVLAASGAVNEKRPAAIYLVVTNNAAVGISISPISPLRPAFLQCTGSGQTDIAAGESHVFEFAVNVVEAATPGKHLLVFPVTFSWKEDGSTRTGTVVASHEVTVTIFGESELLAVLGVPSFLLLPGFLILVTVTILWQWRKPKGLADSFPWRPAQPEFWVVALPLSALMALAYAWWLRRDYLEGYELVDIARVWCASVVTGVVAWALLQVVQTVRRRRLRWSFSSDDKPEVTLQKLHGRGSAVSLTRVEVLVGGVTQTGYRLGRDLEQSDSCWVAPRIEYKWADEDGGDEAIRDLQRRVEQAIDGGSPGEAARLLAEARDKELLQFVDWSRSGHLRRPTRVDNADVRKELGKDVILYEVS